METAPTPPKAYESKSPIFPASSALGKMFSPRSIALIGATEKPSSVGRTLLENLQNGGFKGNIYPVNPKHDQILGLHAFRTIEDIPEEVDLAIIATPATSVPDLVGQCARANVTGAVVISAGFKECGTSGRLLERDIQNRRGQMRIIGPNCLGTMIPHVGINATFAADMALPGKIAFLSQSGALCTAVLDWSLSARIGFSAFVSIGSMLDVGWGDLIEHFGEDSHTESIVCYMESIGDARTFLSAAREVSFTKPIVVIKVGRTDAAAKAAASHTGSMTGSDAALDAAFRRAGILRVDTIEELFDMAQILANQPRPKGPRLAIVTNAGGPGALATDRLVGSGGSVATLDAKTNTFLSGFLPTAWSHNNPIDILGEANADLYARTTEAVLNDPHTDGVLVVLTPQAMTEPLATANRIADLKSTSKPILASWMGGGSVNSSREFLKRANIPTYDYPDAAANAFALMWRYGEARRLLYERPKLSSFSDEYVENSQSVRDIIDKAGNAGRILLTEAESKELLAAYGIPVATTHVAETENEAVRLAEKLGYPVVLKLLSEKITHKSDVGGVKLDLRDPAMVRKAWRDIKDALSENAMESAFAGVTLQPFISHRGTELILGSTIDPQLGPVLLFGAGGELVEILKDRAIGFPPLTITLAHRLMAETRIFRALQGFRSQPAADLNALAKILVRFSHLVVEQRRIAETDINPLFASATGVMALDARVVLHAGSIPDNAIPFPAIRPYPAEYVSKSTLKSGQHVLLRPILPEDEEMLAAFHAGLSKTSVCRRYFASLTLEERIQHERLARICFADYARQIPIVVEHKTDAGKREIIAVGRINRVRNENTGEFTIIVSDEWQNQGVGHRLLEMLLRIGYDEKLSCIVGQMDADNPAMLHICKKIGCRVFAVGDGKMKVEFFP